MADPTTIPEPPPAPDEWNDDEPCCADGACDLCEQARIDREERLPPEVEARVQAQVELARAGGAP